MLSRIADRFLVIESDLLRQGGWLLASVVAAGICNYAASVFAARLLGPVEYGTVNSLTAVAYVMGVVAGIAQTAIAGHTARLRAANVTAVGAALKLWLRCLLAGGLLGAIPVLLSARSIAAWLNIASPMPVIMIGLLAIPTGGLAAVSGTLQGMSRFASLGGLQFSLGTFRLLFCVAFVLLGTGATGAVASQPASAVATLALGIALLGSLLREREGMASPVGWFQTAGHVSLALVSFAILVSVDVVIAKNRFGPAEAGAYSGIATLGRTGLWLSTPVAAILLPKVTERYARGEPTTPLLRTGLWATAVPCGGLLCAFLLLATPVVRVSIGPEYAASAKLLGAYSVATVMFAIAQVWAYYFLAVQEVRYSYILLGAAALLLSLLLTVATTPAQFVIALTLVGALACLAGELLLRLRKA
jgi:O-antigen/teichoic acid export membrane protein